MSAVWFVSLLLLGSLGFAVGAGVPGGSGGNAGGNPVPGCSTYAVIPPPSQLINDFFPYPGGDGFRGNLFSYNQGAGRLMSGDPEGPYFQIVPYSGTWNPTTGQFSVDITLYDSNDDDTKNFNRQIGTGTITSNNLTITAGTWTNGAYTLPVNWVGGTVTVTTSITANPPTLRSYLPIDAVEYENWQSFQTQVYFSPGDIMPLCTGCQPLMNRRFSQSDATELDNFYGTSTLNQITADSPVVILWGSNGWNGNAYVNYNTGMDFIFGLTCSCCSNPVATTVGPNCNHAVAGSATAECATLTFDPTISTC